MSLPEGFVLPEGIRPRETLSRDHRIDVRRHDVDWIDKKRIILFWYYFFEIRLNRSSSAIANT